MNADLLRRIGYLTVLTSLSFVVLVVFLRPTTQHVGINQYDRAMFLDMIDGNAYKPFVSRTLLPTTVRLVSAVVPEKFRQACAEQVQQHDLAQRAFDEFRWDIRAAFQYLLASVLMLLSFMGFAHCVAKLTARVCDVPDTGLTQLLLAVGALVGLPPFFRYTSFVYDPPQLFLFTLALYFLATNRIRSFFVAFVACCLNKETAVLLIPVCGLTLTSRPFPHRRVWGTIAGLSIVYVSIKCALAWVFRDNLGSHVEFHFGRNIQWLAGGWTFTDLTVFLSVAALVFFHWSEKPAFLRFSFPCVLIPLVVLTLFLGLIDEWRDYYEAYPIACALLMHSLLSFNRVFRRDPAIAR